MTANTKPSMPEIWLQCFYWLIFHSLGPISHSGALHCKVESSTCITCFFGTERVHWWRLREVCAEVPVSSCTNFCWHSPAVAVKHRAPHNLPDCAVEKLSLPPSVLRIFFLFRAFLWWNILRWWTAAWSERWGKVRYGFDLGRRQKSGAAASGRGTILISVRNRGCWGLRLMVIACLLASGYCLCCISPPKARKGVAGRYGLLSGASPGSN